jgi:hypothetical protein
MKATALTIAALLILMIAIFVDAMLVKLDTRVTRLETKVLKLDEHVQGLVGLVEHLAKHDNQTLGLIEGLTDVVTTLRDRAHEHAASDWTHGTLRANTNVATVWLTNSTPPVRRYFPPLGDANWHSHVIELGVDADGGTK